MRSGHLWSSFEVKGSTIILSTVGKECSLREGRLALDSTQESFVTKLSKKDL